MNSLFECATLAILRTLTNDGKSPIKGAVRSGNRYKPTDTINRELRAANLPRCLVSMIVEEVTKANHNTLMREIRLLRNLSKNTSSVSPACRKRRLKGRRYIAIVADTA